MDIVKMATAAAVECERQQVGLDYVARLLEAAHIVHRRAASNHPATSEEGFWKYIAGLIEPRNLSCYRQVPVSFADMSQGIPWANVPRAMESWWSEVQFGLNTPVKERFVPWWDQLIKEFLKIHPFVDGNGRTAWLMRVWMLNQWNDPQPLPNYFPQIMGKQTV